MLPRTWSSPIRAVVGVMLALLVAVPSIGAPQPVAAVPLPTATTTTIEVAGAMVPPDFSVTVRVRPNPVAAGAIGACVFIELDLAGGICIPLDSNGDTVREYVDVAPGSHSLHAAFAGGGELGASEATLPVSVGRATTVTLTSSQEPAENSDLVTISARVAVETGTLSGGTLTIVDSTAGTTLATGAVGPASDTVSVTRRFAVGTHSLAASYSGNLDIVPSTAMLDQHVTADTSVAWSGLQTRPAVFYPVVDGYRDTLRIDTLLGERAKVVVRVRNAAGHVVRTRDLGWKEAGAVHWSWNGRNDAGAALPAGTYRVTMRATDVVGNTATSSADVRLSRKSLHWHTQAIEKHGDAYGFTWDAGDGWISQARSSYANGVRLRAGQQSVAVRYGFRLREAVVYGSLKLRVLGRSPVGLVSRAGLWYGRMNVPLVSPASADAYDLGSIGPAYRWWTVARSSAHRDGTRVFGQVLVKAPGLPGASFNTFDIAKVQLVYRYAVLE